MLDKNKIMERLSDVFSVKKKALTAEKAYQIAIHGDVMTASNRVERFVENILDEISNKVSSYNKSCGDNNRRYLYTIVYIDDEMRHYKSEIISKLANQGYSLFNLGELLDGKVADGLYLVSWDRKYEEANVKDLLY